MHVAQPRVELELRHLRALARRALAQVLPKVRDERAGHAGDTCARTPQVEPRVIDLRHIRLQPRCIWLQPGCIWLQPTRIWLQPACL